MENNIILPRIYTKEMWEIGGKRKYAKQFIGKYYISWSQIESFRDKKGFNTGLSGSQEYCLNYFFGVKFPDMGWGQFGHDVENYITEKKDADKFEPQEIQTLDKIEPLGEYQREVTVYIKDLDIIVLGYIDDMTPADKKKVIKLLRDYKTKSESSKKDLHDLKKMQIELYTIGLMQEGFTVEEAEYLIIERLGGKECMNGGGREVLKVGEKIWRETYDHERIQPERLEEVEQLVVETVKLISAYYKVFLKYFK